MRNVAACVALLVSAAWLSACHTAAPTKAQPNASRQAAPAAPTPATAAHFIIDSERSRVWVLVYRDGPMAHLGHNHVIAVRNLTGSVVVPSDPTQSTFQMDFPVEAMSVDEAALRAALGADFATTVDEAAIAGTREHMLGASLLNSKQYPQIHLQSLEILATAGTLQATTRIQVRDTITQAQVPVTLQASGDDLTFSGGFDLTHSQLGLTPYSVALGALRVAERLHVRYQLLAHRQS